MRSISETRRWKQWYPDPVERAEAMELMDRQARAYDPVAVGCTVLPDGKLMVEVIDRSGTVSDFRMDIWASMGEVEAEWHDIVDHVRDRLDRWYTLQQDNRVIAGKADEAAFELAVRSGMIYRLPNGEWCQAEPSGRTC